MFSIMNAARRSTHWSIAAAALIAPAVHAQGRIQGTVHDSIAARPLDSAFVQLAYLADPSVSRSAVTDERGRFRVDSLRPGQWIISLMHPRIDSAGVSQLARQVQVQERAETRVQLALPSAKAITRQVCGRERVARDSSGFVHGQLSDARRMRRGVRGGVRLEWVDAVLTVSPGARTVGYTRTPVALLTESDSSGRFIACGVPIGGTVRARGITDDDSTGQVELQVPSSGIARLDLSIGPSRLVPLAPSATGDSVTGEILVRRGEARLVGAVRMRNGVPLPNALVTVPGTGLEARTDSAGTFRLAELPSGSYTLEARAVGFVASRTVVDILQDGQTDQLLVLDRLISIDTVMIRANRAADDPRLEAFEQRRRSGVGIYRTPQQIAELRPFRVADILRTVAGIRVVYDAGRDFIRMRMPQSVCTPEVFIDGMRTFTDDGDIDRILYAEDIRAVEVYTPMLPTPSELLVVGNRCGVVAILTGARR
jgi:hypothetical protein